MRKAICLTGDDTQGGIGKVGTIMQITTRRSSVGIRHLFCPVEEGSNPGEDRDPPNVPKTPLCERERERVGRNGRRAKEREKERERGQERERGREGERDPQSKSRGLTGTVGGWWVGADQGVWAAIEA